MTKFRSFVILVLFVAANIQNVNAQSDDNWTTAVKTHESEVLREKDQSRLMDMMDPHSLWFEMEPSPCGGELFAEIPCWMCISSFIQCVCYQDAHLKDLSQQMKALEAPDDPYFEKLSPQKRALYIQLLREYGKYRRELISKTARRAMNPEQKRQFQEMQIMLLPSKFPFWDVTMFEALDLSREQKRKLHALAEKFDPELEELRRGYVDYEAMCDEQLYLVLRKSPLDDDQYDEVCYEFRGNFSENEKAVEVRSSLSEKAKKLKEEMLAQVKTLLTVAQKKKLNELMGNPTKSVQNAIVEINQTF